jgi:hypothetical protein
MTVVACWRYAFDTTVAVLSILLEYFVLVEWHEVTTMYVGSEMGKGHCPPSKPEAFIPRFQTRRVFETRRTVDDNDTTPIDSLFVSNATGTCCGWGVLHR